MRGEPKTHYNAARAMVTIALLAVAAALTGCGFRLSGAAPMQFERLYINVPAYSSFGAELKRHLASSSKTQLVDKPEEADVILQIYNETQESQILALSAAGAVRELQFGYIVTFRLHDNANRDWIVRTDMRLHREMTYDDRTVLAKESEQALLYQDMREDAVRQMVRRLSAARAPAAPTG